MNKNIKTWKLAFNPTKPKQFFDPVPQGMTDLVIEMLEFKTKSPSDMIMAITTKGMTGESETPIYFYQLRDQMILEKDTYILRLNVRLNQVMFTQYSIEIKNDNNDDFDLIAYFTPVKEENKFIPLGEYEHQR